MVVSFKNPDVGSQADIISSAEAMRVAQSTAVTASPTSIAPDTAASTGSAPPAAQQLVIEIEDGSVLRLPEGVSLEQPRTNGADLEFVQPDGTIIVVPNGAITGLSIILGEVEIPEFAVAALFEANGIETAAGPGGGNSRSSSGGNFEQPVGGIGPAFDIGDLLPPTALSFNSPEDREYFFGERPERADEGVTINGLNVTGGELKVDEDDLPDGTSPNGLALTQTGIFTFSAKDGFGSLSIGGIDVRLGATLPQTIVDNATGTLVVTGFSFDTVTGVGAVDYRYTLKDNTLLHTTGNGENSLTLPFPVIVKDGDGSQANASLDVTIVDDVPTATDDTNSIGEDATSVGGNVLANDVSGADGGKVVTTPGTVVGKYGTLVLDTDGSYTYTRTADLSSLDEGEERTDSVTYTIKDGDGDESTATLTVTITGSNDTPEVSVAPLNPAGATHVVQESGLTDGSTEGAGHIATGSFTLSDPDGLDDVKSVTINGGTPILIADLVGKTIPGAHGTLKITAYNTATGVASYEYTLTKVTSDVAGVTEQDSFTLTVSDGTASSADAFIVIDIVDDVPNAVNDSGTLGEDATSVSGNVVTNDLHPNSQPGADGLAASPVVAVNGAAGNVGLGGIAGSNGFGTFKINADGSYTYTRTADLSSLDEGEERTDSVTYTIKDGDGDESTATLTVTITGSNDIPVLKVDPGNVGGANDKVQESGLTDGSTEGAGHIATGSFTLSDPDGLDDVKSVTINGGTPILIADLVGKTIPGAHGTLKITAYNTATGVASYEYTLTKVTSDVAGVTEQDSFTLTVSDGTASSADAFIVIDIVDDVPNAVNDSGTLGEDATSVSGNVVTNDLHTNSQPGADGLAASPVVAVNGAAGNVGLGGIAGSNGFGTFKINADGSYTYTRTADLSSLDEGEERTDSVTYTIKDGDGDESTATLTVTITGSNDIPVLKVDPGNVGGANDKVQESGLTDGSTEGAGHIATGSFTLSDPDGLDDVKSVTINGGTPILIADLVGKTIPGAHGTLKITAYNTATGVASYEYTLTKVTSDVAGVTEQDSFTLTVSDGTASSADAFIVIDIVDDVPNAVNDSGTQGEDATSVSGNVVTNDLHPNSQPGADGLAASPVVAVNGAAGNVGLGGIAGSNGFGTFKINADGSYTYTRTADLSSLDEGEERTDSVTYTIKDGDGDESTATLTVTITGSNDIPVLKVDPGNVGGANDKVQESGLTDGSTEGAGHIATGSFTLSDPDGLDDVKSVTINGGTPILIADLVGKTIPGAHGTLKITAYNTATGVASYEYTLTKVTSDVAGVTEQDSFTLTVSDGTASSADAFIVIDIVDDVPNAVNDSGTLGEDATSVSGNVVTNDLHTNSQPGADGLAASPVVAVNGAAGNVGLGGIAGSNGFGTFKINADGSYTYTRTADLSSLDEGEERTDSVTYTIKDGDGDESTATLTVTITGSNDIPVLKVDPGNVGGANDKVQESGLTDGSTEGAGHIATGSFTLSDPDGLDDVKSVTINGGTPILIADLVGKTIPGAHGTLKITAYNTATGVASYEYTLTKVTSDVAGVTEQDSFTLTVSDGTASSADAFIVIDIVDDVPNAVNDSGTQGEDATSVSGNVVTNDLHPNSQPGADGLAASPVVAVNGAAGNVGLGGIAGSNGFGTFTINADGSYTYTRTADLSSLDEGEERTDSVTYTIKDGDGDESTATLTVTITGSNDIPVLKVDPGNVGGANDKVQESGLTDGSTEGAGHIATGSFTLSDPDGLDDVKSVTINGGTPILIADLVGKTIPGAHGTLKITAYNTATGVASYEYTLTKVTSDVAGVTEQDSFTLTVSDGTASSADAFIVIDIVDDVPNAVNDSGTLGEIGRAHV